ncbi:putative peroxiredoxin [Caenibius tardaugens NBRC 16725]|uniref:thioredoxin-dependent peroxiredoxin n=1 Tax=Caenibius tardaugens NBRC 16725 TaxID=1219035 RepID=U2YIN5_9SPHN|nr:peroxiredoxin [Caenibius tardaugens]AZI37999.1 peroxiredoxin [Caenibius tardaugens NBRC 16725]GAD47972.1 putative peroxiredoxin [Caenibius tardaugens NBRC 16725]
MKRLLVLACALSAFASPALAALPVGAKAPQFATKGALAGKDFAFDLRRALADGPVVLYFYPKAFTQGCTLEANAFAEAMPQFQAAGAKVIGLSADDLPTLRRFSTKECRDAFPVAIASPTVIKAYDVALVREGAKTGLSDRTSYVIGKNGRIIMVHSDLDWREHVKRTLAAVKSLKSK